MFLVAFFIVETNLRVYVLVRDWFQRYGKSVCNTALLTESCGGVSMVTVRSQLVCVRR